MSAPREPPVLSPCPCGAGRPVERLTGRRHSFARGMRCSKCGLTSRESASDYWRAVNWNDAVLEMRGVAK